MAMTLDEFLAEVDRWKQPVSDRMSALSADERKREDAEAQAWLEARLGRRLHDATKPEGQPAKPS